MACTFVKDKSCLTWKDIKLISNQLIIITYHIEYVYSFHCSVSIVADQMLLKGKDKIK